MALLGAALAVGFAGAAFGDDDAVYQWTDPDGVVRYTDDPGRIPRAERDTMVRLEAGMPVTRSAEPAEPPEAGGTIPSMLGGPIPESATSDEGEPSLTTTAPTPAPAPRGDAESPIGQPIPAPDAAGTAPFMEEPQIDPGPGPAPGGAEEPNADARPLPHALPGWWGPADPYQPAGPPGAGRGGPLLLVVAQSESDRSDPGDPEDPKDLDARIRELEHAVARDEERLKDMISADEAESVPGLEGSPELREIARRLPALQVELRDLRRERAAQQAP